MSRSAASKRIYMDYAGATPLAPETLRAMREAAAQAGNPGAIHREGVEAKESLNNSRARVAALLGVKAREVVFTSGLTESNALAIVGRARRLASVRRGLSGTHWITASSEHPSVLGCFSEIESLGGEVTHVEPDSRGIVEPGSVERALRPETALVSIAWAQGETGAIQPLAAIASVLRAHEKRSGQRVVLHADAGQAPLYLPTVARSLGVDLLSIGSEKLYGPRGIGALWMHSDVEIAPLLIGGTQERGLRPGTENVMLAAGFAAAFEAAAARRLCEARRLRALRDALAQALLAAAPGSVVNGDQDRSLPHMLNISVPGGPQWLSVEYLALALDSRGIAVATKSACREGEESRSRVVAAMYPAPEDAWRAARTLRFSLGTLTRKRDIRAAAAALTDALASAESGTGKGI